MLTRHVIVRTGPLNRNLIDARFAIQNLEELLAFEYKIVMSVGPTRLVKSTFNNSSEFCLHCQENSFQDVGTPQ